MKTCAIDYRLNIRLWLAAFFLVALFATSILKSQGLDPIQQPAVGVRVIRKSLADERGSGFVISVDDETLYILTARHLFYSEKKAFTDQIKVTFALDMHNEYTADWYVDFSNLDLAVLKVSMSKLPGSLTTPLKDLPQMQLRPSSEPLKLREDVVLVGGKFQDWQLPKDAITGLYDDADRLDRFRFTGTGVHDGFSGSAVLDSGDSLVGMHLGSVPSDDNYGRAQRFADAIPILSNNRIPMNKLDLQSAVAKTNPTAPDKTPTGAAIVVSATCGGHPPPMPGSKASPRPSPPVVKMSDGVINVVAPGAINFIPCTLDLANIGDSAAKNIEIHMSVDSLFMGVYAKEFMADVSTPQASEVMTKSPNFKAVWLSEGPTDELYGKDEIVLGRGDQLIANRKTKSYRFIVRAPRQVGAFGVKYSIEADLMESKVGVIGFRVKRDGALFGW